MVDKKRKGISLIVDEAYQEDIDKGIVRIDSQIMKKLDLSVGDIVLIKGAYEDMETAAIVQRAYPSDIGNNNIRMDPITRRNAGTSVGEKVFIQKVEEISIAKKIILSPIRKNVEITLLDEDDGMQIRRGTRGEKELIKISPRIINRTLYKKPLTKGDIVSIGSLVSRRRTSPFNDDLGSVFSEIERIFGGTIGPVSFGSPIKFQVVSVSPKGIVLVTEDTQFSISDKSAIAAGAGVPEIAYEDIGGLDEEIKKVREMIEMPLKHPEIFDKLGVHPPKGVLLYGPPGTGKTLLAKAVAHESSANFILLNGPEIMSKFVGEAEKKLRDIFEKAEKNAPSIIFIDEIDAIAPKREESYGEVERRVVAQLLALMDGLKSRGKVIVIAATNRQDALDPALRRGGRFDREIEIGVPNKKARLEILQIHTRNMPLDKNVDLKHFAEITHGFVGADLEGVVKEAAMNVIRRVIPEYSFKDDEPIPEEVIKKLIVTKNDFKEGLKNVKPSAMREVLVELPKVKWSDIGGLEKAKRDLKEAIEWPLKSPDSFKKMGIRPPRGVLIYGPPGTGKTLLAKAVANESGANFISVKGPEVFS
ncbi:ATPase, partial [Candidatus Pacearchaeota archaeon]